MAFERSRGWWALVVAAVAVVAALGGTALAQGGSSGPSRGDAPAEADSAEDGDAPISDEQALARASQVALEHTGGGEVTETEVGDEESHYEVEVTLEDGRQVDVQLNEQFEVVGEDSDNDDQDGEDDDEDEEFENDDRDD